MTRADPDEAALIARCNRGEDEAIAELYRRHRGWVLALARRMTRDEGSAQDLVQEAFLDLLGRFPGFRLGSSLRAFLYPVIRHRAIDLGRRARRLEFRAEAPETPVAWTAADSGLQRLVAELPEPQREAVLLRFVLDFRLDEIAAVQGVPLGTVKSRLHHALGSLRAELRRPGSGGSDPGEENDQDA